MTKLFGIVVCTVKAGVGKQVRQQAAAGSIAHTFKHREGVDHRSNLRIPIQCIMHIREQHTRVFKQNIWAVSITSAEQRSPKAAPRHQRGQEGVEWNPTLLIPVSHLPTCEHALCTCSQGRCGEPRVGGAIEHVEGTRRGARSRGC